jgi:hypothetical protein
MRWFPIGRGTSALSHHGAFEASLWQALEESFLRTLDGEQGRIDLMSALT